jgi:hypothetical protein
MIPNLNEEVVALRNLLEVVCETILCRPSVVTYELQEAWKRYQWTYKHKRWGEEVQEAEKVMEKHYKCHGMEPDASWVPQRDVQKFREVVQELRSEINELKKENELFQDQCYANQEKA